MRWLQEGESIAGVVRPGDTVVWGQGTGAPLALIQGLLDDRHRVGGRFSVFCGYSAGLDLAREQGDTIRFRSLGAFGDLRGLAAAGLLETIPGHMSDLPGFFRHRIVPPDVVLVQVAPTDGPDGHSLGVAVQHLPAALEHARVVVAEVNSALPVTDGYRLPADRVDLAIRTHRPPVELAASPPPTDVHRRIADHVAALVPPGAALQLGVGVIPEQVLRGLHGRSDIGFRSGLVTDALVDLVAAAPGGLEQDIVAGAAFGTRRLYEWLGAHRQDIRLVGLDQTHDLAALSAVPRLFSVGSALQVDVTGQVNSEVVGGKHRGGVGGQVDFLRAARASNGGAAVIALPSLTATGASTIVGALDGPVSSARSDLDMVVTEHGVARLWGRTMGERRAALVSIAHPRHRAALEQVEVPGLA